MRANIGFCMGCSVELEADVMHHADVYLLIVTASIPFIALYNGGAAVFRAMGNSDVHEGVIAYECNQCKWKCNLNLRVSLRNRRCCDSNASVRFVAAFIIIKLLLKDKWSLHLERTFRFNPDWSMIRKILSVGIPNGLENSMFQLGKVLVLSLVSHSELMRLQQMQLAMSLRYFPFCRDRQSVWQ